MISPPKAAPALPATEQSVANFETLKVGQTVLKNGMEYEVQRIAPDKSYAVIGKGKGGLTVKPGEIETAPEAPAPKVETLDWWKEKLTAITQEFNKPRVSKKKKYSLIKDAEEARREISRLGGTKTDIQEATYGKPSSTPPAESAKSQISVSEPDVQSSTPVQRQDKAGGAGEKPALETAEPMAKAVGKVSKNTLKERAAMRPWDIIDEIRENIGSIRSIGGMKPGHEGYYGELYKVAASGPARQLFKKGGQSPDEIVDTLRRSNVLPENATVDDLWDALDRANKVRGKYWKGEQPEQVADKFYSALEKNFSKKNRQELTVGDLSVGDKFKIQGEEFKVTGIDPDTGEVSVKDGPKFKSQTIPDGADIAADPNSFKPAKQETIENLFEPEHKKPKLAPGVNQGDLISSTQKEDFALVGERGADLKRIAAEKAKAERDAAEAKALDEKQQLDLLNKPPKPISMGGLNPSDPMERPSSAMPTANKNANIDADRVARGEAPLVAAMRQADADLWDSAMAVINDDWMAADKLIDRFNKQPFVPTDKELVILLQRRVDLKNEFAKAARDMALAAEEGRTEAYEASRAQRDNMLERLRDVESIVGRGDQGAGTMAGRALRARQLMMNDDFSMASMVIERESALGRKLTEPELAEVQKLAEEYRVKAEANEKRVAELTKQVEEAEAARIAAQAAADAKQIRINPKVLDYAEKLVLKLESRAEIASARLREKLARASSGVDPTIVLDLAEIGVAKLGRNALDFAKWSKVILDEFGPKIQDYLKDGYEASKRLLDEELNRAEKIKGAPRIREVIISKPSNQPEMIVSKLSKTLQKNPAADIAFPARRLARSLWTPNIKPMELVDKVHGLLKQVLPDITKRDTMDALSGYGRYKMLKKDALSMGIRDINQQLQQLAKLDDMAKGKAPVRTGFERQSPSDEGRRLIKQVEEAKKKGGYNVTDPETQLRTAMQAAQRRLENQIKDLEHEIQTRHRIVKNKRKLEYDDKLKGLQARRDALKEIHDEVFKPEPLTDAQRLAIWKEKALDKIDDYRERIAAGDIHPKPRPDPVRFDSEAIKLRYALSLVHKAWLDLKLKDHLSKRSQGKKIFDGAANVIRFSRAMMTGGEFSGVLRQGGFLTASHPVITAKALSPMFKALWSEKNQFKINEEIHTRPNAPLYDKAKLDLTEMGNKLSTMEEHYMFTVSEKLAKIWGVRHTFAFVNAFQRAYTTFLNRLRADAFDALVDTYGDSPEMTNRIANLINVATGRGSTGLGRYVGPGANAVFFAPRYSISRFQLLLGQPAWGGSMATRRMVINQYARALGGAAVIYALGSAAGGSIEKDPRSPDFGKIRFGNTRIDPLAGLAQVTRLMATELSGWRKTAKGKIEPIRDQARIPTGKPSQKVKFGQQNGADVIWNFARTKLSPQVALPFNFMSGKDPVGKKFNMKDQLLNMVVPITYGDIADAMRANGFPQGAIFSVLALFGAGVQTYDEKKRNIP